MSTIYLPNIINNPHPNQPTFDELQFINFIKHHPEQQRKDLVLSYKAMQSAKVRSNDMALHNYFSHTSHDGTQPNAIAQRFGCVMDLPSDINSIESIVAGTASPLAAFNALMNSYSHKIHLMGSEPFFRGLIYIGVSLSYNETARYKWYWAIHIVDCE
jgi:uncharacterized protein YkwD